MMNATLVTTTCFFSDYFSVTVSKISQADIWHELYYDTEDFDAEENQLPSPIAERFPLTIPVVGDPPGPSLDAVNLPDETELILPEPGPEQWHDAGTIPDGDQIPLEQQKEEEPINTAEPAPAANPAQEPSSPGTLPLAPMCSPPVAEEPAQPPAAAQEPVHTPETEEDNSDNSVPDRRRMLVQFLVTIDNFTETSFESRGRGILVQAIKDAARQFGTSSSACFALLLFQLKIFSIGYSSQEQKPMCISE